MGGKKKKIDEILETVQFIVQFLQDKVATKDELYALEIRLENKIEKLDRKLGNEISRLEETIVDHVDGFIKLHTSVDTEVTAVKSAVRRHDEYFDQVSRHLKIDLQNS